MPADVFLTTPFEGCILAYTDLTGGPALPILPRPMNAYIGITDASWFELLAAQPGTQEVNFWQPGGNRLFGAIVAGELFLFKPHRRNVVIGGGIMTHSTLLPISLAWEAFGVGNGATSLEEMRRRTEKYRRQRSPLHEDYTIGCILLTQPFFLPESQWVPLPSDWKPNIVQGRRYDLSRNPGLELWHALTQVLPATADSATVHRLVAEPAARYGSPILVQPRLGQGTFRILVTDVYDRRCAVSGEKVLPVLQAAHIRPYAEGGEHRVDNGLLLRSDLHTLFDRGYLTVTPEYQMEVSKRLKEDYENGREYYAFHGLRIRAPHLRAAIPAEENLRWHNQNKYLG